jgi:hypothetical protein
MSDEKPGFIGQLTGVLYRPREIFSTVDESDITRGLIVMIVMVLLAAYSSTLYMSKIPLSVLSPQLEGMDTSQFEGTMGIFAGIGAGLTIIVGWIASTLLMHGMGKLSGGSGSLKRMFALHGFASLPGLFNQLIRVADAYMIDSTTLTGYFLASRDLAKLLRVFIGANLFNIWGLATIGLLVLAAEENYGVSRGRALLIVMAPSIVYLLINYFTG